MIVTPRCFSAEVIRRGLRTFITSNVIWIKFVFHCSSHVPVHHFLSVVLQCYVVRCHRVDVCRTHHWKLRCEPRWADMTKTSRIDHQHVLLSFPTSQSDWDETDLPNSPCTNISSCLSAKISRVLRLRIQSCSLDIDLGVVLTCLNLDTNHRLVYCLSLSLIFVTFDFDFPVPLLLP